MKKVLGILLALTLTVGAFAGLTLLSVSAASQTALVEGKSLTEDFEGNTNQYINAPLGGTVEVQSASDGAQVHGGEYSLKFSGGNGKWMMPAISGDATKQVVNGKGGTYQFHAWVYFETMPVSGEETLSLLFRGTQGTIDPERDHVQFNSANGTSIAVQANQWIELTYTYTLSLTQAADENLYVCMDNMGAGSVLYLDDVSFTKLDNVLGDGTLENSSDGWVNFKGADAGQLERVSGGANGTAWAMKYTPANNKWSAPGFDVGPAVIDDADNNYTGAGAGKYKLTFYAKLADTSPEASGDFYIFLNSQYHRSPEQVSQDLGREGCIATHYNYTAGNFLHFTKEWQKFEVEMDISDQFVSQLKELYSKVSAAHDAYQLLIRFDASEGFYKDSVSAEKSYLIDELTFERVTAEEPEDTTKKVENGNAENGLTGWDVFTGGSVEQVEPGANGTAHAVRFNPTAQWDSVAFDLGPAIIQNQEAGYNGMGAGKYMVTFWAKVDGTVPANTKFEVLLNSQLHTTKPEELAEYGVTVQDYHEKTFINGAYINLTGEWAQYSVVFDVSENFLRTLDDLYAAGNVSAYEVVLRLDGGNVGAECAYVDGSVFPYLVDEVTIGSAKDPVGVQWTINKDVTGSIFISSEKAKGFITADDVKNGKVQKSFTVYNTGEHAIQVQFSASVLHQGTPESWEAVKNTEWYTIPAGQSQLITYECDAKVTINTKGLEKEYSYDQFFPRFDIKAEGDTVKAGTSFIVAGISPEVLMQLDSSNAKDSMTVSMVYELPTNSRPGGDLLPVALIAAVVAAAVVLVVVAKKKKEQE